MNEIMQVAAQRTRTDEAKSGGFKPGSSNMRISRDHIWFYDAIDDESALEFNQVITDLAYEHTKYTVNGMFERSAPSPIWLHINSPGGIITSAMSMVDTINRIKCAVPVITVVEGVAASAATFISSIGSHRVIRENSYMLVHQLSGGAWGNYEQLKDSQQNVDAFMADIKRFYKKNTKFTTEQLNDILKHDLYLNAKKCKQYGLVDDIIL
ncbi:MAG: Clp protease ClpP [Candidatus Pacearchaeota archaeon]|jgi:ATP-dependent Clp endopeptidase proteolytic subunit ClpP|nr:Clp protease ClpP [Clostridia bacterium]